MWIKKYFGKTEEEEKQNEKKSLILPRRNFLFMLPAIVTIPKLIVEMPDRLTTEVIEPTTFQPVALSGWIYRFDVDPAKGKDWNGYIGGEYRNGSVVFDLDINGKPLFLDAHIRSSIKKGWQSE